MTKIELKKWLDNKRSDAIYKVKEDRDKQIAELRSRRYDELHADEMLTGVLGHLTQAADLLLAWERSAEAATPGLKYHDAWSYSIYYKIQPLLTMEDLQDKLRRSTVDETAEYRRICDTAASVINGIQTNYSRVIANVGGVKNAKDAAAYLEDLGFDLSELLAKEATCTALMAQVDTRFLFLNREKDGDTGAQE